MARFNENQFNVPQFNQVEDLNAPQSSQQASQQSSKRSFLLQRLLNYFDDADVRVRESRDSMDAQLLNAAALQLEDLRMRLGREKAVLDPVNCPINVDNFGTYYKVQIPDTYEFAVGADGALLPPTVRVYTGEKRWKLISAYDDTVPVPSAIKVAGDPIPCDDLIFWETAGNDLRLEYAPGKLAFPNNLFLKLNGLKSGDYQIEVILEGYTSPRFISLSGQQLTTEVLILTEENVVKTRYAWDEITRLSIRDLPTGATLQIALAPAAYTTQSDPQRPASHSAYRGILFDRVWQLKGNLMSEGMFLNRFQGIETIQTYRCSPKWSAFALEPNTYGMFGLSGENLVYWDRRESVPANRKRTSMFREPLYNFTVSHDDVTPGPERRVVLTPVRNALSDECYRYRYTVEYPSGEKFAITNTGALVQHSPSAAWRMGTPKAVTVRLPETGSYFFTMDTAGEEDTVYQDIQVYASLAVTPLWQTDLSDLVPDVRAILFDRYQRMWFWTGDLMIPIQIVYDNFVFDPGTRSLYLTNSYDQVELS